MNCLYINTSVENDIEILIKLDKYTKTNNERNYNKTLITKFKYNNL